MKEQKRVVKAMLLGYRAAERRQLELRREQGPRIGLAIAESFSALNAAQEMGIWPGPRSWLEQRDIERVRARWALVQNRAKKATQR